MSITSSAMLVELNISVWTANKVDRGATRKVADDNNAASNAAQVRKNLLAGTTLRKELSDFAASCRMWHNMKTLPWSDRGPRLLPTSLFFDYKKEMTGRESYFTERRDAFLKAYPDLVQAAPTYLGSLFDPNDYPSTDEVASKFAFRMVFSPVPEGGDFRVDLPAQDMQEMRAQYDAAFNDRLAEAMREPWDRLHKMLAAMTEKLNQPDDPDTTRRWHDTFITNARDMTEMLKHLNVTKDPELERARRALSDAIYGIDIEDVKHDADVRENMSRKLTAILDSSW
jgi:hypothetical protein